MKKIVSLLLVVITLLSVMLLSACDTSNNTSVNNNKNSSNSSNKNQNVCSHSYSKTESKATCLVGGYATYKCSLCGDTYEEYENALGHSWQNNKCKRCSTTKDLELDPIDNNILSIEQIDWDINSANGVEPSITFTNHTNKQIAYVYFTLKFYDRMGNPAYCSIRSEHTRSLKVTGPVNADEKDTRYWDPIIYNSSVAAVKPLKIEIEYTDGTRQAIVCTGRYWYSNSYYGGDLKD